MSQSAPESPVPISLVRPRVWHLASYCWRFAHHLTIRRVNRVFRMGVLRRRSLAWRARFAAMGLPEPVVAATLGRIRSLAGWSDEWVGAAQYFLGEARRAEREPGDWNGALATRHAALCYHIASWFAFDDPRVARTCRASAVSLFARSVQETLPETRRVLVPWRTRTLPAYLSVPAENRFGGVRPLVVLLNGVTTCKEELILWRDAYIERGMAVLALDWPGTGELADERPDPDHDDITDGLVDLARHERGLDADRIAVVGFSLGGAMAVRAAALDRRIAAVVAVTPPYDVRPWMRASSPLPREQFAGWSGDEAGTTRSADGFALDAVLPRLKAPLLIFGAGRDLVVPPTESIRLAAAYGERATLVWFEEGGHGLYQALDQWTADSAAWLQTVFGMEPGAEVSTQVDWAFVEESPFSSDWADEGALAEAAGEGGSLPRPDHVS